MLSEDFFFPVSPFPPPFFQRQIEGEVSRFWAWETSDEIAMATFVFFYKTTRE